MQLVRGVDHPHEPDQDPIMAMARNNSIAGQVMEARKFRRSEIWFW